MNQLILFFFIVSILPGCMPASQNEGDGLSRLADTDSQYAVPHPDNELVFPEAHMPQKAYRHEWWYLTANLTTQQGEDIAIQWTLFRTGVDDKHWYFAHAALADSKEHQNAYRQGRELLGNVTFEPYPYTSQIDDWRWQSSAGFLPATLQFAQTSEVESLFKVDLTLSSDLDSDVTDKQSSFFLQGENGFNPKHPRENIASIYYSQPFIKASGRIFWQGRWQSVTGNGWFDREWSSQFLAQDQQGWDWFSLRLDEDTALMVYRIRSTEKDHLYGNVMHRNGTYLRLSTEDIQISELQNAVGDYPRAFQIQVKPANVNLEVQVVNDKQINQFGIEYFEGMVTFSGSHQGKGFVEMTGYR